MQEQEAFKIMRFIHEHDLQDSIKYGFDEDGIYFDIHLSDWFFYASSYFVNVDIDDLDLLEQCIYECEEAFEHYGSIYAVKLFACRKEKLPPLKEYLKKGRYQLPKKILPLFKEKFDKK